MISVTSARSLEIWNHLKAYLLSADAGCWLGIQLELSARTPIYGVTLWSGLPHNMMAGIQDQASQQRELSGNCLLWPVSEVMQSLCYILLVKAITNFCADATHKSHLPMKKMSSLHGKNMWDGVFIAATIYLYKICYKKGDMEHFLLSKL